MRVDFKRYILSGGSEPTYFRTKRLAERYIAFKNRQAKKRGESPPRL